MVIMVFQEISEADNTILLKKKPLKKPINTISLDENIV